MFWSIQYHQRLIYQPQPQIWIKCNLTTERVLILWHNYMMVPRGSPLLLGGMMSKVQIWIQSENILGVEKYVVWWNYGFITAIFKAPDLKAFIDHIIVFRFYYSILKKIHLTLKYVGHYPILKEQPWLSCFLDFFLPVLVWNS